LCIKSNVGASDDLEGNIVNALQMCKYGAAELKRRGVGESDEDIKRAPGGLDGHGP
jgi:hypothetical protein